MYGFPQLILKAGSSDSIMLPELACETLLERPETWHWCPTASRLDCALRATLPIILPRTNAGNLEADMAR